MAQVMIRYSKDGRRTWSSWKLKSLGEVGQYLKRVKVHNLGQFRSLIVQFRISDPVNRDCLGVVGQLSDTNG